jgi:FkbM family methyltransferase
MKKPSHLVSAITRRALTPLIPARKMLAFEVLLEWLRGEQDIYQKTFLTFCGSTGTAIDIGANIGLFTYHLAKRFKQVHAFEANAEITYWMEKYNPGNIHIHHCGLSSKSGTATLHIPITKGQLLYGWSTFHEENLPKDADKFTEKVCPLAPLDDFAIEGVGFIKIDVEGHELEVLKGAAHTIATSRPIVLVEVRTAHEKTVDAWFQALNCGGTA